MKVFLRVLLAVYMIASLGGLVFLGTQFIEMKSQTASVQKSLKDLTIDLETVTLEDLLGTGNDFDSTIFEIQSAIDDIKSDLNDIEWDINDIQNTLR